MIVFEKCSDETSDQRCGWSDMAWRDGVSIVVINQED